MDLTRQDKNSATVITCQEARLDALVAVPFKERFRDLADGALKRVVLDMTAVHFMDSSGLGAVVAVYKLLGPDHGFDLAGLSPSVDRVFRLTRMDSVFAIYGSLDDALKGQGGDDVLRPSS
jgi:anti-sigma B factor antagonist